jgi:hypothetical protein
MPITKQEIKEANASMKALKASTPAAIEAYYDRKTRKIVVNLSNGMGLFFSPQDAQGLEDATPAQLSDIEINSSGFGLYFPKLDADLYVPGLLDGAMGSRKWMAGWQSPLAGQAHRRPRQRCPRRPSPQVRHPLTPGQSRKARMPVGFVRCMDGWNSLSDDIPSIHRILHNLKSPSHVSHRLLLDTHDKIERRGQRELCAFAQDLRVPIGPNLHPHEL